VYFLFVVLHLVVSSGAVDYQEKHVSIMVHLVWNVTAVHLLIRTHSAVSFADRQKDNISTHNNLRNSPHLLFSIIDSL